MFTKPIGISEPLSTTENVDASESSRTRHYDSNHKYRFHWSAGKEQPSEYSGATQNPQDIIQTLGSLTLDKRNAPSSTIAPAPVTAAAGNAPIPSASVFKTKRRKITELLDQSKTSTIQNWDFLYSELAQQLCSQLDIGLFIHQWAESAKWFLTTAVCKEKYNAWIESNKMIESLVEQLKTWYPKMKEGFNKLTSTDSKSHFLLANYRQMQQVAQDTQSPRILEGLEKRKQLLENLEKLMKSKTVSEAKTDESQASASQPREKQSLPYQPIMNRVEKFIKNEWKADDLLTPYPHIGNLTDAEILMQLFIQHMDDILFPTALFSNKHYLQIPLSKANDLKFLQKSFDDIAIVCVTNQDTEPQDKNNDRYFFFFGHLVETCTCNVTWFKTTKTPFLPYYFLIFDLALVEKSPFKRLASTITTTDKKAVGTWYVQPGNSNVFYCIALLAFFIHRVLKGHLDGINLQQNPFLKTVLSYNFFNVFY
ncbi:hypothetical protein RFI_25196 [Reticulomyxa filosa]|uniref:Uncharacterized protein n=1 Tax=Reticulomyxa filosa TaxID=46433 RepID=X6MGK2_RETFI|nr:hypothetical protein RFI_25196 [Reticulomyxa filosa]|eukprot:ETO12180.1 hypothetical protein RFI_25196 [Reticulomyxa filosa]